MIEKGPSHEEAVLFVIPVLAGWIYKIFPDSS